jgi:hypothetical protein
MLTLGFEEYQEPLKITCRSSERQRWVLIQVSASAGWVVFLFCIF